MSATLQQLLSDAKSQLDAANQDRARAEARVDGLRKIVEGYEALIALESGQPLELSRINGPVSVPDRPSSAPRKPRIGLKTQIKQIMQGLGQADIDRITAELGRLPDYADRLPSRNTIGSRMSDLARDGVFVSLGDGVYKLAPPSQGGAGNPVMRGGPHPAIQPDGEKSPGEQVAPAHPGHPSNLEGATGVVHRPGI
jgi:hypothetical protein